jgi:hypothetical protein
MMTWSPLRIPLKPATDSIQTRQSYQWKPDNCSGPNPTRNYDWTAPLVVGFGPKGVAGFRQLSGDALNTGILTTCCR